MERKEQDQQQDKQQQVKPEQPNEEQDNTVGKVPDPHGEGDEGKREQS
jgi:hypothetical protein